MRRHSIFLSVLSPLLLMGLLFVPWFATAAVPPFGMGGLGYHLDEGVKAAEAVEVAEPEVDEVAIESVEKEELAEQDENKVDLEALVQEQKNTSFDVQPFASSRVLGTSSAKQYGELQRLNLDAAIVNQGFSLVTRDREFKVSFAAGVFNEPLVLVLKRISEDHLPAHELAQASDIYEFDVRKQVGNTSESLGVLEDPIELAIKFNLETQNKKVMHFWDSLNQRWVPLASASDFYDGYTRASLNLPFARVALFDEPNIYEGWASWYRQFDGHYAAVTIFPRKTMLKVTNISGSPRHGNVVELKINDYGPDPGVFFGLDPLNTLTAKRLIDLDTHAYLHIAASLKSGIMPVRVEKIK